MTRHGGTVQQRPAGNISASGGLEAARLGDRESILAL